MIVIDYKDQIHRCFNCGYCKFTGDYSDLNCPSYVKFRLDTYSTSGRLWLIRAWLNGEVKWSEHLMNILYTCVTCKNCAQQCPMQFSSDIVDWIIAARSDMMEKERGRVPPPVVRFLEDIRIIGNPLEVRGPRGKWASGLSGVKKYQEGYLFYVGCLGSYDEEGKKMARSVAELLGKAGVSFGILGDEEGCCGNEVHALGEMGLFQMLEKRNTEKFKELGVKKIVTLSPHSYNVLKNLYPANLEVYHYTQLLQKLIKEGKIDPPEKSIRIAYHDPCYLGRHNDIYDPPREVLKSVPGIELVEMPRNRENSFCCGGGSGNFAIDLLGGSKESPSKVRVREAHDTGARILAVACPSCLTMLIDAVKAEGLEDELAVRDISQIIGG